MNPATSPLAKLLCHGAGIAFLATEGSKLDGLGCQYGDDMMNVPVGDGTLDYAIACHVIAHQADPIGAFRSVSAKLKDDGIAWFVFPKRNDEPLDGIRPLTTQEEFVRAHLTRRATEVARVGVGVHHGVYSLQSFLALVCWCNRNLALGWVIEAIEETESTLGQGHAAVFRKCTALADRGAQVSWQDAVHDAFATVSGAPWGDADAVEQASVLLRIALSLEFSQPEALFLMGRLLHERCELAQSREFMQQALILLPEHDWYRRKYFDTHGMLFCNPIK